MYLFIIYLYAYYIEVYGNIVLEVFLMGVSRVLCKSIQ